MIFLRTQMFWITFFDIFLDLSVLLKKNLPRVVSVSKNVYLYNLIALV